MTDLAGVPAGAWTMPVLTCPARARFVVSPGFGKEAAERCRELGVAGHAHPRALAHPSVLTVDGSWMATADDLERGGTTRCGGG